jgi:type IV fimbrial biogenesis protein FimT
MERKVRAFTLIELVVTLTVVSIIAALAAPSFSNMIQSNRVITNANTLLISLNFARSEAVSRGLQVIVRRQGPTSQVWDEGWQVFVDRNQDGDFDDSTPSTHCDATEDCLLRVVDSLPSGMTLRTGANYDTWMGYLPDGTPIQSGAGGLGNNSFTLCGSNKDIDQARQVIVNTTGRARVGVGVASCPS